MGKTTGGTRNTRATNRGIIPASAPTERDITPAQFERYVNEVAQGEYPAGWDELDAERRELALMEAGFTGFADDGAGNIMFPDTKESLLATTIDAIINDSMYGEKVNSDTFITIAYKDGTTKSVGALGNEIELSRPLTNNQLSSTQTAIVRSSLKIKDIAYITLNDAFRETYWIAPDSEAQFKRDTGYEYWKKGRGEKRRDYIQDDWI